MLRRSLPVTRSFFLSLAVLVTPAGSLQSIGQSTSGQSTPHVRHSRYPSAAANDPLLQLPQDQAQACFTPESTRSGYDQFEQYDTYSLPASKGYLCINIPSGGTFVIDHMFAEADYDTATAVSPEWYLDSTVGAYELLTGFTPQRAGSETANPHYILSQQMHFAVAGGTRVTLFMHSYYVGPNNAVQQTPGTGSLTLVGHWE